MNASENNSQTDNEYFLSNSWQLSFFLFSSTSFLSQTIAKIIRSLSRTLLTTVSVFFRNLYRAIWPLMISYPIAIYPTYPIFTAAPYCAIHTYLLLVLLQQYKNSSVTHWLSFNYISSLYKEPFQRIFLQYFRCNFHSIVEHSHFSCSKL